MILVFVFENVVQLGYERTHWSMPAVSMSAGSTLVNSWYTKPLFLVTTYADYSDNSILAHSGVLMNQASVLLDLWFACLVDNSCCCYNMLIDNLFAGRRRRRRRHKRVITPAEK